MIMARWPNADFENGTIWNKEDHWAHGVIDQDDTAYENGTMIDSPHGNVSLENIGFNIEGATAILNVGSFKTFTREVLSHNGNTFTYEPVDLWKTKHHDYFLERKLEFLDVEGEWFYDVESSKLYFWPPNDMNPNFLNIRGKNQSYAFEVNNSDYVELRDLEFLELHLNLIIVIMRLLIIAIYFIQVVIKECLEWLGLNQKCLFLIQVVIVP